MNPILSISLIDTKGNLNFEKKTHTLHAEEVYPDILCPEDLHIAFFNDKVIILDRKTSELTSESQELHATEKKLTALFPDCKMIHIQEDSSKEMVAYAIIDEGKKLRAKGVKEGKVVMDSNEITVYEQGILGTLKEAILAAFAKNAEAIHEAIEGKSEKEQLIYFLDFRSQVVKDTITYGNGHFDLEFIHKLIPRFIDADSSSLHTLKFIKYKGINITDDIDISTYIQDAYARLPEVVSKPKIDEEE